MNEAHAEMNTWEVAQASGAVRSTEPRVSDKEVFESYARSLVRRQLFLSVCGEDHPCVRDEERRLSEVRATLTERLPRPQRMAVPAGYEAIRKYLTALVSRELDSHDEFEDEVREEALAEIVKREFSDVIRPQ